MRPIEYVELQHIDKLLQCGICYEYIDTGVMTLCSHNYCSLCIRKYLHYKTQCPICYEQTFEKDLRKNKLLDEIITEYLSVKEKLENKFKQEETSTVKYKNCEVVCSSSNSEYNKEQDAPDTNEILYISNSPILTSGNITPHKQKYYQQDISTPSTSSSSIECRIPSMFTPKNRKGFRNDTNCEIVICPVCKVDVAQNNINKHLDQCLKRENSKDQPKKSEPKRKLLPKLVLNLMKDSMLRKKLKELGLSSQGDRKSLESRLQKYTILYNAECDKINPRPVLELIKQFEEEENLEKKVQNPSNRLNVNKNTEHNVIEQERKKYLAAHKNSFGQLIEKMKHAHSPRKLPVKRNILSRKKSGVPYKDCVTENDSISRDGEKSNFLPLNSTNSYIEDSDSNASCPLQMYSSENPTNLLTVQLSSMSDDATDQCASNHGTLTGFCETNLVSFDSVIKKENIKTEKLSSSESILPHEEIISNKHSGEINILDRMDIDTEELVCELTTIELKNRKKATLSEERNRSSTKYSPEKHVAYSKFRSKWREESYNKDSFIEDIEPFTENDDSPDVQNNYENSKHEQLHNMKEYSSDCIKFEKENLEADENIKTCVLRKREREMTFTLSDEEKIEDKSTNTRKSLRLGLSEAKGFNNENFAWNEEKSQSEKEGSHATGAKSTLGFEKKSVKLRSKIGKKKLKL